ncbi:TPA: PTS sugar transporter subunit IIC [Clostridioides difficile]|uniref:Permease IIC component n=3 Tax=Clostridioides difficile TaxID=1496 RepID=A0AAN5VHZ0_CLODI|nr:PTS sugar transporter subunit IIC [Clostridioides difficile]EQE32533.1 phosphotransferase system, EIIC family protein [Clostridioides difficile CD38]EQE94982.1 phosphotransferase system, EIIC family protein [Clostridioides difficile CD109]EQF93926.1 phosphotransferase system, EIIC family protein [Clostridioides difficile 840]EQH63206.1 phosphotransferase system, EIIC family protein [Clostridioides difficile DA00256]EQI78049.1 phosphotransferase system, EIIC family protein [Clostridioides di
MGRVFMNKFIDFLSEKFTPVVNNMTKNIWVQSVQSTIMKVLPMVFVGSLVTIVSVLKNYISFLPDLSPINQYTFGLLGLFIAFLLPMEIMKNKKFESMSVVAGLAGAGLMLMMIRPEITNEGAIFNFNRFGGEGMLVSLVAGLFSGLIMSLFGSFSFFGEDSALPDFVSKWFDNMLPITVIMFVGWGLIYGLNFDMFEIIVRVFKPVSDIAQTLPGFVLLNFLVVFIYSLGISGWVLSPITYSIQLGAIAANAAAVASGGVATNIYVYEVIQTGWITLGGLGATLPLVIMMCLSRVGRIKAIGRACIVPSIMNINEPVIFGAPVAWNPFLMLPMWIGTVVISITTYLSMSMGFVTIPSKVFNLWYVPFGISTFTVNQDVRGLIVLAINIVLLFMIWYPFFKAYEKEEIKLESQEV